MRRWVWRVLLIAAVMAALTVGAAAEEVVYPETGDNGIRYDLSTGTVLGPANLKTITQADIQATVNNVEIKSIASNAFELCENLKKVTIPRTVTSIGSSAFLGCRNLEAVELPEGLTAIPNTAFYECEKLGGISIPTSVTSIGTRAFYKSGLSSVTFPAGLSSVGAGAFESCGNLTSVTFQDEVGGTPDAPTIAANTTIGPDAFNSCKKLERLTLCENIKSIGDRAFSSCDNLKKAVIFQGTDTIGLEVFSGCPLTEVVIFSTTSTIGSQAFQGMSEKAVIHYAGSMFPEIALPAGRTVDNTVHTIKGNLTMGLSTSCTTTGSVRESLTCQATGCTYRYNEPARVVPPRPHTLEVKTSAEAPTCTKPGQLERKGCTKCDYTEKAISIPALGHLPQDVDTSLTENRIVTKEATCSEEGVLKIVTKRCQRAGCGEEWESKTEPIKKLDHTYPPDDPQYNKEHILIPATCESVGLKVIDQVCSKCGHVEDPTADCETCKAYLEKKAPTEDETKEYIDHVKETEANGGHDGTDVPTVGHEYVEKEVRTEPTCTTDGSIVKRSVCKHCGNPEPDKEDVLVETLPKTGHKIEKIEDKEATGYKAPTCTEAGHIIYKEVECSVCHQRITPDSEEPEALGHDWQKVEGDSAIIKEATCKEEGQEAVGKEKCSRPTCKAERGGTIKPIPRKPHTWTNPEPDETKEDVPATCGKEGESHVISTCSVCGTKESRTIKTPATGQHNWGEWTTKEPTETQAGEKKRICADCKKEDVVVLPATGGSSDPSDPDNPDNPDDPDKPDPTYLVNLVQGAGGSVSANKSSAASGDRVTLTTWAESGYELDMVRVISASGGVPSLTELGGGQYRFTMPASNVEVRVTFQRKDSGSAWSSRWASAPGEGSDGNPRRTTDPMPTQNPTQSVPRAGVSGQLFRDIPASHWAAGEISWANQMGYMNGSAGRFNPDGTITHQQMWMVLARLTGSRPANMTEARRWAVENSFADGSSPDGAVARHQLVTALYRSAHLMGSTNRNTTSLAGYTDSRTVPAVARDAFSWAVANGIVGGTTNGRLDPNGTLTRAQFAVILYRYSQRI